MSYPPPYDGRQIERKIMKMRSDSVFAKLTEDQRDMLVDLSAEMSLQALVKVVAGAPEPIQCTVGMMSKFLKKAAADKRLREAQSSDEAIEAFAKRGEAQGKVREAAMAAMRDRMFEQMIESNDGDRLMDTFGALSAEKEKERLYELEARKVKVAEENAKLGWRKLECENARSGVKLLPKVREMLMDSNRSFEERVKGALDVLGVEGAKLLAERNGGAQSQT